jgi:hypothetical protein
MWRARPDRCSLVLAAASVSEDWRLEAQTAIAVQCKIGTREAAMARCSESCRVVTQVALRISRSCKR